VITKSDSPPYERWILLAFGRSQKNLEKEQVLASSCLSVRPSDFGDISYLGVFRKSVEKIQI